MRILVGVSVFVHFLVLSFCDVPKDYIVNPSDNHGYKLIYLSKNWAEARDACANMGAKLAVPKSLEQFTFIQKIVRTMQYREIVGAKYKHLVWLGISNLENYQIWANVDGENIEDTGFHTWAGSNGHISTNPVEPHCAGLDSMNQGLRDWWCHLAQPYICEILVQSDSNSL